MARQKIIRTPPPWRQHLVLTVMVGIFALLAVRVVHLQTRENEMLQEQGKERYLREIKVSPQRGRILDRNGEVLSISTPVDSIAAQPTIFCQQKDQWGDIGELLGLADGALNKMCDKYRNAYFMYLRRQLPPAVVQSIMEGDVPGLEVRREYKRYFPGGPVGAHLLGFTDIDDRGQEGLELNFNGTLKGRPGRKWILKDLFGRQVEGAESIEPVRHGEDLQISIDQRVQSLASRYLETAVKKHQASGGSVVVIAIPSGEIISMVNSPQFNANDRNTLQDGVFRNKAVTDVVEPGSTVKPFTIAMAMQKGSVTAQTMVDTTPGTLRISGETISDVHSYGEISVSDVIVRSSNVGAVKLALAHSFDDLFETFRKVGFGRTAAELPGETAGSLLRRTRKIEHATLAYGYGLSVTPLQLARAYTVFATDGKLLPVTIHRMPEGHKARGKRVFTADVAMQVRRMLEGAATPEGTARKARIPRYRIGGKTGTTQKSVDGSYENQRYVSLFAGLAPIADPQFIIVVSIDDPRGQFYYGGDVAAPVFASLMDDLMRLYNVRPDAIAPERTANSHTGNGANWMSVQQSASDFPGSAL